MGKKSKSGPGLKVAKPKSVFERPFQVDYKGLFKSLSKGIIHVAGGKFEEAGIDATETLSSLGLKTEDPGELAFLLINRSMTEALLELVRESSSQQLIDEKKDPVTVLEQLDFSSSAGEVFIDRKFLDRPSELPFLKDIQSLLQKWLESLYVSNPSAKLSAKAIADRLPSYFVYALNQEWRKNAKTYFPIIEALDTPFAKAGDREWAWSAYSALLQHKINEAIFDEPFSLSQIYVPLNAFYLEDVEGKEKSEDIALLRRTRRRVVVSLEKELEAWLKNPSPQDAIWVIGGGPGSGKSSFARIFAAKHSQDLELRVLYVPLHLIDASRDLVEAIGRFVKEEGILPRNPLSPDSPEPNLLIIFDGLDELASQGKAAAETARAFVREVDRTVEKRNQQGVKLRVLLSGRELVVQENESEFRHKRQILTLLPYFIGKPSKNQGRLVLDGLEYRDPENLLENDLRKQWWIKYGSLTSRSFSGMPAELDRADLAEVTAQPLLNYLVALSFTRKKLDFKKDINLNKVYADLVAAVHERGYDTHRYVHIRHMTLDDFFRVLEEIGLASWHGDGRTTTVREIQEHCRASGLSTMLEEFQEGAEEGVTRLLAAFFFRKYGQRSSGDSTFVFTHKSFGEYLTARRIVRAMDRVIRELERRSKSADEGWDEKEALRNWTEICGPSAITPYLRDFLLNEMELKSIKELTQWQSRLSRLFSYMLQHGMPMEMLGIVPFKRAMFQSRNAEEALLVALNSCATITKQISPEPVNRYAFGEWFRRIQGQHFGYDSVLAVHCLSFLNLSEEILDASNFSFADLSHSNLYFATANLSCFYRAILIDVNLSGAMLLRANLEAANLGRASLIDADLEGASLIEASLIEANLGGASFRRSNLEKANLRGANLEKADLEKANLRGANLEDANLEDANLRRADLEKANLRGANLEKANLEDANLRGADLEKANLEGAKLPANFHSCMRL